MMTRLRKRIIAGLAVMVLLTACGADGQADPGTASGSVTPTAVPTPTPTPEPTLPTEEPTTATPSASDTLQTNAWGDDPVQAVKFKVKNVDGHTADLIVSFGKPLIHTSRATLPEGSEKCVSPGDADADQPFKIATVRVVVELWPDTKVMPGSKVKFEWPKNEGVQPDIQTQYGAPMGEYGPCGFATDTLNPTFVTPEMTGVTSWFVFTKNLTPNNPNGWVKPYPWTTFRVDVRQVAACKVTAKTAGFVVDPRYPKDCGLEVTLVK